MTTPVCPYCSKKANMAWGRHIWPDRPELAEKHIWRCLQCSAYVGCHGDTWSPLGTLANYETRRERMKTHKEFDPLWKSGTMSRSEAYLRLSKLIGIPIERCHIAMFTAEECKSARTAIQTLRTLFL